LSSENGEFGDLNLEVRVLGFIVAEHLIDRRRNRDDVAVVNLSDGVGANDLNFDVSLSDDIRSTLLLVEQSHFTEGQELKQDLDFFSSFKDQGFLIIEASIGHWAANLPCLDPVLDFVRRRDELHFTVTILRIRVIDFNLVDLPQVGLVSHR